MTGNAPPRFKSLKGFGGSEEGEMKSAACAVLALLLGSGEASATVYNIAYPSITVSGTITTNGATGTLTASDITSWNINQTDTTFQTNLNPLNSSVSLTGDALSATASQLLFNFSDTTSSLLDFASPNFFGGSGGMSLQFCDATGICTDQNLATSNSQILLVLIAPGLGSTSANVAESGLTTIGAAAAPTIPEPSTWVMILMGFAGLGFLAKRRRGVVTPCLKTLAVRRGG